MGQLYISKSRYFLYKQCPYAYKLCYIDKVEPEEDIYLTRGQEFHDFVEYFWENVKVENGKLFIPSIKGFEQTNLIKNFLLYQIDRWKKLKKYRLEKYFLPISFEEMLYDNENLMRGKPDAIFKTPNDRFIVVDYKTSQNINKNKILTHMKDFLFYDILVGDNYGVVVKNIIYYPHTNLSVKVEPYTLDILENWKNEVRKVKEKILNFEFPKKESPYCKWCSVRKYCKNGI